ncbi:hypothetical protein CCP3SC1_70061 [Gammaproteobacteria bacterium]
MADSPATPAAPAASSAPVASNSSLLGSAPTPAPAASVTPAASSSSLLGSAPTPETPATPPAEPAPGAVPEKYELKSPEDNPYDPEVLGAFSEVSKDLKLSQDSAQKILDKVAPVIKNRQMEMLSTAIQEWGDTSKADKEFGGERFDANLAIAQKGIAKFGTPALISLLNQTGLGNHPEVIRAFYRAGKSISEDTPVAGKASPKKGKTIAERLYTGN